MEHINHFMGLTEDNLATVDETFKTIFQTF